MQNPHERIFATLRLAVSRVCSPPIWVPVASGVVVIILVIVGTATFLADQRTRDLSTAKREVRTLSVVLAEQMDRSLQTIETVQTSLIESMRQQGIDSEADFIQRMSTADVHNLLRVQIKALSFINKVALISVDGRVINFSAHWPIPKINVSDRDYFLALRADSPLIQFVSKPVQDRGTGVRSIFLARKFTSKDGRFLGLVLGAISVSYFEDYFHSILPGPGSAIALFRNDGVPLASYPHAEVGIGGLLNDSFSEIAAAPAGNATTGISAAANGSKQVFATSRLSHFPMVIRVSTPETAALAGWRHEAIRLVILAMIRIGIIAGIIYLIVHVILREIELRNREASRRIERAEAQLRQRAEAALRDANAELERRVAARTGDLEEVNLRLQAEMAEHRVTEAALRQAQRMEAIGQLTGGIAHDFNNLLTVVVSNATLLRDRAADEPTRRWASAILGIAERGERLTRQLLTFSRRRMLRPEPILLQERAGEIIDLLTRSLREDIRVTLDVPEDLRPVSVDPGEFDLALLNIGVNARDAMPKGGAFRLAVRNMRCGGGAVSGGLTGDFVAITLSDTGTGMPAEVMAHAFEPYFTTKNAGLGSGLGLSQVYGFASQSGGTAVIESEPGKGTVVTIFLPCARAAPPAVSSSASADTAPPSVSARVLLVEDDEAVAEATRELLRDMGFETRWVQDGNEALALIERGLSIDLVLSDVVMPGGVSGLDLARTLRERRPGLPVILGTGYSLYAPQVISEGIELVEKPYHRDALAALLRSALEPAA